MENNVVRNLLYLVGTILLFGGIVLTAILVAKNWQKVVQKGEKWTARAVVWGGAIIALALSVLVWGPLNAILGFALIVIIVYLFTILILVLGHRNIVFTIVDEGQAKGITRFGRAHRCVMAYMGHRFRCELTEELTHQDSDWDVISRSEPEWEQILRGRTPPEQSSFRRLMRDVFLIDLGGLHWVGVWPFYRVYDYTFRWTSLRGELPEKEELDQAGITGKKLEPREQRLDYLLVRQETYVIFLVKAEDKDLIPVDIIVAWTGKIVNPFKGLFRIQEWLETASNRALSHLRRSFGQTTWQEFQQEANLNTPDKLGGIITEVEDRYGWRTDGFEIIAIKAPEAFGTAAIAVRQAQAEAEAAIHKAAAVKTLAEAEAGRIKTVFGAAAATELAGSGVAMKMAEDLARGPATTTILPGAGSLVEMLGALIKKGE